MPTLPGGVGFITGGARGLGNAVAVSMAKEGATAVVLVDIITDEEVLSKGKANVEAHGAKCITIHADVSKDADMERAVAEAVKAFGRIDYAANFAGISGPAVLAWDCPTDELKKVLDINTTGVIISQKYEMKQMLTQDPLPGADEGRVAQRGSIVNTASVNSVLGISRGICYTSSKHAVVGLTKCAALDGRSHGIRVNAVSPGFILSELLAASNGAARNAMWKTMVDRQGREASAAEIGDAVALLSSPKMSLVVGHNLVVDGGFTINEAPN